MTESAEGLRILLQKAGFAPESVCAEQMQLYLALLEKWNATINLTATTAWSGMEPLFAEAIRASAFYPESAGSHLDVGSGNGFPAIPLRILRPQMILEMVESRSKRCAFLETAANALGFSETRVHNTRLDQFLKSAARDKVWNCISWKALKLGSSDLRMLLDHAGAQTEFWMFHGKELAVDEPAVFLRDFKIKHNAKWDSGREWALSIYHRV